MGRVCMQGVLVLAVGLFVAVLGVVSSSCARMQARPAISAAAEATYLAEHLSCVDRATTLAESRGCRAEVDRRWGIITTTTEAGHGER